MAIKTNKDAIVAYWQSRKYEGDMACDWDEARDRCWRCGTASGMIERAHIVPQSLGGCDSPANLILLCSQCHVEAPNVPDADYIWLWIKATKPEGYREYYWWSRWEKAFVEVFGRRPRFKFPPSMLPSILDKGKVIEDVDTLSEVLAQGGDAFHDKQILEAVNYLGL